MTTYFLDSSALVKRYALETGTAWVSSLCDLSNSHTILIANVTIVEVAAALASKQRSQEITTEEHGQVMQDFIRDVSSQYQVLGVDQRVITLGVELTGRQKLRGYDAGTSMSVIPSARLASVLLVNSRANLRTRS